MSKITNIVDSIITKVNEHSSSIVDLENDVSLKAYISDVNTGKILLKTIATGTATFTATTNNINLTGIGIGVEIGDVIQISGAIDTKNNSEFTVEVITDADNVIVNQAHANKGTTKNVASQAGDTGVTVKLLAKWYNAPIGLGQGWVDVTSSRLVGQVYTNNINRVISISIIGTISTNSVITFLIDNAINQKITIVSSNSVQPSVNTLIPIGSTYEQDVGTRTNWLELR